jgi:diacylglycerol kinase (ATP)
MRFSVVARLKSFSFAFEGFAYMLRTQHNAWVHAVATIVVVGAGFALNVGADAWRWLIVALALVWVAEAMNTAFEHLCDVVSPDLHESVKRSKDIAAAAVLVCVVASTLLGAITLGPYVVAAPP